MRFDKLIKMMSWGLCLTACSSVENLKPENSLTRNPASVPAETSAFVGDQAQCQDWSDTVSLDQKKIIGDIMASHSHRLNHVLWHSTRNAWNSLAAKEKKAINKLSPEWGKHAPLCPAPTASIKTSKNPSGEEFLFMHHQMIDSLRVALEDAKLPCITGWKKLPAKNDPEWGIPEGDYDDSSKSDEVGTMMDIWLSKFNDPKYLKGKSLSFVGYLVEFSLHNNMHMRWASIPTANDSFSPFDLALTENNLIKPTQYDDPKYNWLGNPYSAHVNPVFWKLHGWVDQVIPHWLKANGYEKIATNCTGIEKCYQWKSHWTGMVHSRAAPASHGVPHSHGSGLTPEEENEANRSIRGIFSKAGFRNAKFDHFKRRTRAGPIAHGGPRGRDTRYDDPAKYVKQFGPCSP